MIQVTSSLLFSLLRGVTFALFTFLFIPFFFLLGTIRAIQERDYASHILFFQKTAFSKEQKELSVINFN